MSAVCILTPVVIAAWPAFGAAVTAAATSLGYTIIENAAERLSEEPVETKTRIALEIDQSEIVTDQISRAKSIHVTRDGVTVTFSRDARGKASLCVEGEGHSKSELQQLGEELSQRVVQKYVHQRLLDEMEKREFVVVEDEVDENDCIRLKVRHWEN